MHSRQVLSIGEGARQEHRGFFVNQRGEPYRPTVKKLLAWYTRESHTLHELDADTAAAALFLLMDGLPEAQAEATRQRILDVLRESYSSSGAPPPEWLKD